MAGFRRRKPRRTAAGIQLLEKPRKKQDRRGRACICLLYTSIPEEGFTPLFASARIAGWCANRIEEVVTCHRIMRPAYRAVTTHEAYIPMDQRGEHLHLSAAD